MHVHTHIHTHICMHTTLKGMLVTVGAVRASVKRAPLFPPAPMLALVIAATFPQRMPRRAPHIMVSGPWIALMIMVTVVPDCENTQVTHMHTSQVVSLQAGHPHLEQNVAIT